MAIKGNNKHSQLIIDSIGPFKISLCTGYCETFLKPMTGPEVSCRRFVVFALHINVMSSTLMHFVTLDVYHFFFT